MDKKKIIYIISGVLLIALVLCFVFNGNKKRQKNTSSTSRNTSSTSSKSDSRKSDKKDSQFFRFLDDETTISGLTEEGKKQTVLVIPKQVESLRGLDLDNSVVEEVSFEADHDVKLEAAFTTSKTLKKVTLPAKLSIIPYMAFGSCTGLESIVIPAGVTKIDENAFSYCTNLKEVIFAGKNCEEIGEYAFELCESLEKITLPEGLTTIDKCAFFDCDELTSVTLPSTIKSIGGHAFNDQKLSEVHFSAGTENVKIEPTAFGVHTSDLTVYITKGSWMDKNRDSWNVGFTNIVYE